MKIVKFLGGIALALLVAFVLYVGYLLVATWFSSTHIPIRKMVSYYEKNSSEMERLANYANCAVDDSAYLWLMLYPNGDTGLQGSSNGIADTLYGGIDGVDTVLCTVGLTGKECDTICQSLKAMGCIGVKVTPGRRETQVLYKYGGPFDEFPFGYILYSTPMTDEERINNLENDHLVPYCDRVVFLMGWLGHGKKEAWMRKYKSEKK